LLLLLLWRGGRPGERDLEIEGLRLLLSLSRLGGGGVTLRLLLDAPPLPGLCRLAYFRGGDLERLRDLGEEGERDTARRRRGGGGVRSLRPLYLRFRGGGVREGDRGLRLLRGGGERETDALRLGVRGGEREDLRDGRRGGVGLRAIGVALRLGIGSGEREDRVLASGEGERLRLGGDLYRRGGERELRVKERERRRGDGDRRRF
jgi:hypothetical protein